MPIERLGRYELLEELCRESGAIVYRANDPLLARRVAIACAEPASTAAAALERKARLAGGLVHPNIVAVYDAAAGPDVAYIATELAEGRTLRELLDADVPLAAAAIERIAAQVADGLDFMHRHAIVHGAIDASSVIVLDIGFVKIACPGNALVPVGSATAADGPRSLSPYASPEHVTGAPLDARSDVFGLGALLYEMLTRTPAFPGSTADELAHAILNDPPRAPSAVNPGIPSGFDYIVARALSKDPGHRYQTAAEMASQLRRWALEEPTFFAVPGWSATSRASAGSVRLPSEQAVPSEMSAPAAGTDASRESSHDATRLLTRRAWLRYGIAGALVMMGAAWSLRSRLASSWRPTGDTVDDGSLSDVRAPEPQAIQAGDAVSPSSAPREAPPATASVALPAQADPDPAPVATAAPASPAARVKLAVSPWGEIYVDGRRRGVSPPLRQIELAPGRHTIEIRNTTFPPRRESFEMRANARRRIKHKFK